MKKCFALLFVLTFPLLIAFSSYAEQDFFEYIEEELEVDLDTANAQILKEVVDGIDGVITPYADVIDFCLARLETMGETQWVMKYREKYPNSFSNLSYIELVSLKEQINLAMWESKEWQEVTVPQGVWKVGEDIPAGTWIIKCADFGRTNYMLRYCDVEWGESLHESGTYVNWRGRYDTNIHIYNKNHRDYEEGQMTEYILTVKDGDYIIISGTYNQAVFTTYTGKPSLGFK